MMYADYLNVVFGLHFGVGAPCRKYINNVILTMGGMHIIFKTQESAKINLNTAPVPASTATEINMRRI